MRKITLIVIVLLIINCARSQKKFTDKTVVRLWHPFSTTSSIGKTLISMIDEFNKTHPQWSIKPEGMGSYSVLKQKLLAAIIAGNQPELSLAYESWISKFYIAKKIVVFDEFVEDKKEIEEIKNDLFKVFIKSCTIDGNLVALPFNKSTPVLYYNKDLFKKHNITKPPRTWDEFLKVAKKLTIDKDGDGKIDIYGIISRANLTDFMNFLKQNNGEVLSADGKEILFNKKEGVEALKFFYAWKYLYNIADFYISGNPYEYQNDFTAGKCGMIIGSCVSRFFMKNSLMFRLGTAPIFAHKKDAVLVYGTNIVLFNDATDEQKKAGWEFIKWFISPENTARWSALTAYMPVRRSALKSKYLADEFKEDPELKTSILQLEQGYLEPQTDSWLLGRQYLSEAVNNALIDNEIQKAYKEFKKALNSKSPELPKKQEELERVMEQRIKYHLDKAAEKMRRWVL